MLKPTIAAVMIHVSDVRTALDWYARAFPEARKVVIEKPQFECLSINDVQIEIVLADEQVTSGAAGSVVYWQVSDISARIRHLLSLGAELYRGPLTIENGLLMCQVRDPWGNCIGLRGKLAAVEPTAEAETAQDNGL